MRQSYIADLERKLKAHSEQEATNTATVVDLQRELTKSKDSTLRLNAHVSGLESRLASSEAHSSSLTAEIEKHEKEAQQQASAYRNLESHIAILDTSEDTKALLEELDHRDIRIGELQDLRDSMHQTLSEQKAKIVDTSGQERQELRAHITSRNMSNSTLMMNHNASFEDAKEVIYPGGSTGLSREELTPPVSPQLQPSSNPLKPDEVLKLQAAMEALAARCIESESRYHLANSKVADLTAQLSEANLIRAELDDVPVSAGMTSPSRRDAVSEDGSKLETPQASSPSPSLTESNGYRRRGLKIATSAGSTIAIQGRDFRVGRGSGESQRVQ